MSIYLFVCEWFRDRINYLFCYCTYRNCLSRPYNFHLLSSLERKFWKSVDFDFSSSMFWRAWQWRILCLSHILYYRWHSSYVQVGNIFFSQTNILFQRLWFGNETSLFFLFNFVLTPNTFIVVEFFWLLSFLFSFFLWLI